MKKAVKIFSVVIIFLMVLSVAVNSIVYAQDSIPNPDYFKPNDEEVPTSATKMISTIATIIQTIGIIICVIIVGILGIKYMVGSVEEKADYNKAMIPYIIGTALIVATSTIVKLIANLTTQAIGE